MLKSAAALLVWAVAQSALAQPFIDLGASSFQRHHDGVWFQSIYPHRLQTHSLAAGVGYNFDRWVVGYHHLGRVTSDALADPSDDNFNRRLPPPVPVDKLPRWIGDGTVQMLYGGYRYPLVERFYIEPGAGIGRLTWRQRVLGWYWPPDGPATRRDLDLRTTQFRPMFRLFGGYQVNRDVAISAGVTVGAKIRRTDWRAPDTALYNGMVFTAGIKVLIN